MTTNHHIPIVTGAAANAAVVNVPLGQLDAAITAQDLPAFLAVSDGTPQSNVTGDGTAYTPIFGGEIFDYGSNYNHATGVFTAPVTGRYFFVANVDLRQLTSSHTLATLSIVTSNRTYTGALCNPYACGYNSIYDGYFYNLHMSVHADMDISDTAYVQVTVSGGAKVVATMWGGLTVPAGWFSGELLL